MAVSFVCNSIVDIELYWIVRYVVLLGLWEFLERDNEFVLDELILAF